LKDVDSGWVENFLLSPNARKELDQIRTLSRLDEKTHGRFYEELETCITYYNYQKNQSKPSPSESTVRNQDGMRLATKLKNHLKKLPPYERGILDTCYEERQLSGSAKAQDTGLDFLIGQLDKFIETCLYRDAALKGNKSNPKKKTNRLLLIKRIGEVYERNLEKPPSVNPVGVFGQIIEIVLSDVGDTVTVTKKLLEAAFALNE
jgi:hypothetical protein